MLRLGAVRPLTKITYLIQDPPRTTLDMLLDNDLANMLIQIASVAHSLPHRVRECWNAWHRYLDVVGRHHVGVPERNVLAHRRDPRPRTPP